MKPQEYTSIERVAKDLYKVSSNGSIGLIRSNGTIVANIQNDEITPFYENKALLLKKENGKSRIMGCITIDGNYTAFAQPYYTLAGQAFYSDDLLSVSNSSGSIGYIDDQGSAILGFNNKYDRIKPFSEGFASITKKGKYNLINKQGKEVQFIIGVSEIYGGTNVYKGTAFVWDTDGDVYSYDVKTNKCVKAVAPSNTQKDYLNCFIEETHRSKNIPFQNYPEGKIGLSPVESKGKYGFTQDDKVIVPCQFTSATPFEDGLSVVEINGKKGILKYNATNESFFVSIEKSTIVYTGGHAANCRFNLLKPQSWKDKPLKVIVTEKSTGNPMTVNIEDNSCSFSYKPTASNVTFDVSVYSGDLNIWNGQMLYTYKKQQISSLQISISVAENRANEQDKVPVTVSISNTSDESVSTLVNITGSPALVPIENHSVTIPAHGTINVSSSFNVKKHLDSQYIKATTSHGESATKDGLTLEPFY